MAFSIPPLRAYDLKLYPTYAGGRTVNASRGDISADSRFTLPATAFTPDYRINGAPQVSRRYDNSFFQLGSDQSLNRQPVSQADNFQRQLAFSSQTGRLEAAGTPASAPQAPERFNDYLRSLGVSDHTLSQLLKRDSFELPALGLKVFTDGSGNVESIRINNSLRNLQGTAGVTADNFGFPNRTELFEQALLRGGQPTASPEPAINPASVSRVEDSTAPIGPDRLFGGIDGNTNPFARLAGTNLLDLQGLGQLQPGRGLQPEVSNPVLDRLISFQRPEQGLAVAGLDSDLTLDTARQLAANRARLDVSASDQFRQTVSELVKAAVKDGQAYGQVPASQVARAVDGSIQMAPVFPAPVRSGGETAAGFGMDPMALGAAASEDATSRKGRGGYIPFQMSAGGDDGNSASAFTGFAFGRQGGQGGEGQTGQQNPDQQQSFFRQSLYYQA